MKWPFNRPSKTDRRLADAIDELERRLNERIDVMGKAMTNNTIVLARRVNAHEKKLAALGGEAGGGVGPSPPEVEGSPSANVSEQKS